jgi:hypothetical protein
VYAEQLESVERRSAAAALAAVAASRKNCRRATLLLFDAIRASMSMSESPPREDRGRW